MEDIEKRLKAVEIDVAQLKAENLSIAERLGRFFCTMEYNLFLSTRKGEEIEPYIKLWRKKLDSTMEEIKASKTPESTFVALNKFDDELLDYIKATKVSTADKAMEIAHSFIKKYSPVALPLKAVKEGDVWLVDIDVGALAVKIAQVKVDARTGDILSYDIPQRGDEKK